jgi:RNA-directed DNA polymerase
MFKKTDSEIKELFGEAQTRKDIANLLEIDEKSLRYYLFVIRPENMYRSFSISKKNGGSRQINAPLKKWRNIQRKMAYILTLIYKPKVCAYGFIKQKNILGNALQHTKKAEILNIDLKDFFTQFHFGRIAGLLKSKPYSLGEEAAITIAQIACLNGVLPQGAPTSPVLTNMLCAPLDNQLMQFAKKHRLIYTRYADDITFSSYRHNISGNIIFENADNLVLCDSLKTILKKNNLVANEEKITFRTKHERQEVTGVVINKFPNIRREYLKNIRALLHNCQENGIYNEALKYIEKGYCKNKKISTLKDNPENQQLVEEWYKSVLIGKIRFVKQIKGAQSFTFFSLALAANKAFSETIFDLTYFDQMNAIIDRNVFVLQTNDGMKQGSGFYVPGYGLFTSYHVTEDEDFYYLWQNNNKALPSPISVSLNQKYADNTIDYALYDVAPLNTLPLSIGKSSELKVGDTVVIAGFPDYMKGDTITKEECKITGMTQLFGAPFYKISGRIVHGASGGIVLNTSQQVVGIIKGGCPSDDENNITIKQGFVPIDLVTSDIQSKTNNQQ